LTGPVVALAEAEDELATDSDEPAGVELSAGSDELAEVPVWAEADGDALEAGGG
jgi:hypothetical protein